MRFSLNCFVMNCSKFNTKSVYVPRHINEAFFKVNVELSGRVLDSKARGCGFDPYERHWVVSLSTGSTQKDPSRQY